MRHIATDVAVAFLLSTRVICVKRLNFGWSSLGTGSCGSRELSVRWGSRSPTERRTFWGACERPIFDAAGLNQYYAPGESSSSDAAYRRHYCRGHLLFNRSSLLELLRVWPISIREPFWISGADFSRQYCSSLLVASLLSKHTRSSAIAEVPRDASCQLKSCQLPRNSTETIYTTSPDQIDGMKLEI